MKIYLTAVAFALASAGTIVGACMFQTTSAQGVPNNIALHFH